MFSTNTLIVNDNHAILATDCGYLTGIRNVVAIRSAVAVASVRRGCGGQYGRGETCVKWAIGGGARIGSV
jgi:hypothetical protein